MTVFGYNIQPARRRFSFANWFQNRNYGKQLGIYDKSEYGLWAETVNPLHGLTASKAADIFDQARRGVYADLAWLYQELEAADPTLFTCTENREAAVELAEWRVVLSNPDRTKGFEENLANEQQDFLSQAYGAAGDEMEALASHLERGFFRGFAHARPVYSADGFDVDGFEFYDQWNFARDLENGQWWWNPDASGIYTENFKPVPPGELITLTRTRHIDYPMLDVGIRAAIGEKKYAQWMEKYGIPPVTIIMPQFADKTDELPYMEAAKKMAAAGSGALPFGSQVNYANEARGINPFTDHLRHQQELTVLMATGGLLTTLTAPDSGTLAGSAHTDTWQRVVGRDLKSVGRSVNRTSTKDLLDRKFPGCPHLVGVEYKAEKKPTPSTVLEDAAKAKTAGYIVVQSDLEEKSGYKLQIDTSVSDPFGGPTVYRGSTPITAPATSDKTEKGSGSTQVPVPESETKAAKVSETGMNGAQVTALLEIIEKVKSGAITLKSAPVVMQAAFPLLEESKIKEMLPKPDEIAAADKVPALNKEETLRLYSALHCISHGGKISNKGDPSETEGLESVSGAILGVSQNPINEALKVIENGGSEAEAMAAYDKAASAVLSAEKIAEGAEEISKVLEAAARSGKEADNE